MIFFFLSLLCLITIFCFFLTDSSTKNEAAKDAALQEIELLKSEVESLKRTGQSAVEKSIAIWQEEEKKRVEAAEARDAGLVTRLHALTRKIAGKIPENIFCS